jgi:uncharacterized integral membrane protein (TIGR00697 family)
VAVLLCSNLIGTAKVCTLYGITFGASVLFFPISYLFGDVLTEVYGYARARRVVWTGLAALVFASFVTAVVLRLPPAAHWELQGDYERVFGQTPRIVLASLVAYLVGEFANSYVLARMKVASGGRQLWKRTIGSTLVGEAIDSLIFFPLAFAGTWPRELLIQVIWSNYLIKAGWEIVLTPLTYRVVAFLKRAEGEDYFDRDTSFNPFSVKV